MNPTTQPQAGASLLLASLIFERRVSGVCQNWQTLDPQILRQMMAEAYHDAQAIDALATQLTGATAAR